MPPGVGYDAAMACKLGLLYVMKMIEAAAGHLSFFWGDVPCLDISLISLNNLTDLTGAFFSTRTLQSWYSALQEIAFVNHICLSFSFHAFLICNRLLQHGSIAKDC